MFNVESEQEIDRINEIAGQVGKKAGIALRVNPNVDPQTHPYITTGLKKAKFGITMEDAVAEYKRAAQMSNLEILGIDCHIGSQLTNVEPFVDSIKKLKELISQLGELGIELKYLDLGGGLGIPERPGERALALDVLGESLASLAERAHPLRLRLEPGRFLVAEAGVLLAPVTQVRRKGELAFVGLATGMNSLLRPALYGAWHGIHNLSRLDEPASGTWHVVGPICESGDVLGRDRILPDTHPGDVILLENAGAYGAVMASSYNRRRPAAELIVDTNPDE